MQQETSGAGGAAVGVVPSMPVHMHQVKLHNPRNPGQFADCAIRKAVLKENEKGFSAQIAYEVYTKRGMFTLIRNHKYKERMFVLNTKNQPGNLRGWEWFYEAPCGLVVPYG